MGINTAGLLGTGQDLTAGSPAVPYGATTGNYAVGVLTFCNRNSAQPAKVRAGVTATANSVPGAGEWTEYDTVLGAGSSLTLSIAVGPVQKIVVQSDVASVSASFNGIESTVV